MRTGIAAPRMGRPACRAPSRGGPTLRDLCRLGTSSHCELSRSACPHVRCPPTARRFLFRPTVPLLRAERAEVQSHAHAVTHAVRLAVACEPARALGAPKALAGREALGSGLLALGVFDFRPRVVVAHVGPALLPLEHGPHPRHGPGGADRRIHGVAVDAPIPARGDEAGRDMATRLRAALNARKRRAAEDAMATHAPLRTRDTPCDPAHSTRRTPRTGRATAPVASDQSAPTASCADAGARWSAPRAPSASSARASSECRR